MMRELTDDEIKAIQQIQLEILCEVDRICRAHNIKYGIDGGTLLGAIRHRGFIPWDPDIDVIMSRAEYEKFYHAAQTTIDTDRFFLQEERTDKSYRWGHNKIRRNGTRLIREGQEHLNMRDGIFIDVLVYDNVPDNAMVRFVFEKVCYWCRFIMYSEVGKCEEYNIIKRLGYKFASYIPVKWVFSCLRAVRNHYNRQNTMLSRYMTCRYTYNKALHGIDNAYFEEYDEYEFEGKMFWGFKEYDKYLTLLYGDYMKLPPIEKRKSHMPISRLEINI